MGLFDVQDPTDSIPSFSLKDLRTRTRIAQGGASTPPAPDASVDSIPSYTLAQLRGDQPVMAPQATGKTAILRKIAGYLQRMLPMAGTVGGGMLAGAAASPSGPGALPAAMLGSGLGNAIGHKTADLAGAGLAKLAGVERVDNRTIPEHLKDTGKEIAEGAVAEATGRMIPAAGNSLLKLLGRETGVATKALPSAADVTAAMDRQGVPSAPIEMVSTSGPKRLISEMVRKSPAGGGLQTARADLLNLVDQKLGENAASIAPTAVGETGRSEAGAAAQRVMKAHVERFNAVRNDLDDALTNHIQAQPSKGVVTKFSGAQAASDALDQLEAKAPGILTGEMAAARSRLKNVLEAAKGETKDVQTMVPDPSGRIDANGQPLMIPQVTQQTVREPGVPFDVLMKARRAIGAQIDGGIGGQIPKEAQPYLKQAYAALAQDTDAAAVDAGAKKLLDRRNLWIRVNRDPARPVSLEHIDNIIRSGNDQKALDYALSGAQDTGNKLWALRRSAKRTGTTGDWDTIAANTLFEAGRPNAAAGGDALDPSKLIQWWDTKMSSTAKDALLTGTRYSGLRQSYDDLVTIARRLKAEKVSPASVASTSGISSIGTYRNMLLYPLAGAGVGGTIGHPIAGAAVVGGGYAAGRSLGRLFTNPKWVRILTNTAKSPTFSPTSAPSYVLRMWAAVQGNHEDEQEMQRYVDGLKAQGLQVPDKPE